ncbi:cytochrome b/b6 domain-containing protein [Ideonella livida]|uniref:Cytochrome B n=1 Tax=Ideonella livida TaxID=2707176 RepID=A0A7C9TJI6_9BURK|nr:cytochrome b/b6 domain-containing protein [Ideonella livida]NDY90983.1 cytochrome B [Ideonella livida]
MSRPPPSTRTPLVWDLPVRLIHALTALCFAGAWLSAESERWHLLHITLGYTVGGLVAFRLVWGWVGSPAARFRHFVRGPAAVTRYLRSLLHGRPEHHDGHNPAGGWAVLGLLTGLAVTVALGWATEMEWLPAALEEAHEATAAAVLTLVGVHLLGVASGSWAHGENLARAMVTGRKRAAQALATPHRPLAALLLCAVLGFWAWQWQSAPQAPAGLQAAGTHGHAEDDHEDD